jgi:hypothetical protein
MHIHLPKPLHGWREFVGEVGIIVLGVLIALGAEQGIQSIRARHLVRDTDSRLRSELYDNLANAFERLAMNDCLKGRLAALRDQLATRADGWRASSANLATGVYDDVIPAVYRPPQREWPQDAWRTAMSSGVLNDEPTSTSGAFTQIYTIVAALQTAQQQETAEATTIGDLAFNGPLSPSDRRQDLKTIARLNAANSFIIFDAKELLERASAAGIRLPKEIQEQRLAEERRYRGICVKDINLPANQR